MIKYSLIFLTSMAVLLYSVNVFIAQVGKEDYVGVVNQVVDYPDDNSSRVRLNDGTVVVINDLASQGDRVCFKGYYVICKKRAKDE